MNRLLVLLLGFGILSPSHARDFYVDSRRGHDARDGLSAHAAWQSLERVGEAALQPGDRLRLDIDLQPEEFVVGEVLVTARRQTDEDALARQRMDDVRRIPDQNRCTGRITVGQPHAERKGGPGPAGRHGVRPVPLAAGGLAAICSANHCWGRMLTNTRNRVSSPAAT